MKTGWLLALCASAATTFLASAAARADDKAVCLDAAQQAQNLRDAHRLVEAREQLRACARQQCPAVVQKDCVTWLGEVEKELPTVVVTAKDEAGSDLTDVRVTLDGGALLDRLDGSATPVNPGMHAFHFAGRDGASADRQVLVKEGQKDQGVAVVLRTAVAVAPPPPPAAAAPPPPPPPPPVTPVPPPPPAPAPAKDGGSGTWKTVGWVAGGIGAAGIIAGAVAGVVAIQDKNGAGCEPQSISLTLGYCTGSLSGARSAASASDVGFIAGGVLLAGGLALVILAPGSHPEGASVKVAPVVGTNSGGLVLGGQW